MSKVVKLEFRGLHRTFEQLRGADRRSIVAAYRHGQVVDALHKAGYTWEELAEEIGRKWRTVKLYAMLYNKYDTEQELIEVADQLDTYNVAKLAGHTSMVPIQYVLHCTNCGTFEGIIRERRHKDDPSLTSSIVAPKFQAPPSLQAIN